MNIFLNFWNALFENFMFAGSETLTFFLIFNTSFFSFFLSSSSVDFLSNFKAHNVFDLLLIIDQTGIFSCL